VEAHIAAYAVVTRVDGRVEQPVVEVLDVGRQVISRAHGGVLRWSIAALVGRLRGRSSHRREGERVGFLHGRARAVAVGCGARGVRRGCRASAAVDGVDWAARAWEKWDRDVVDTRIIGRDLATDRL
jgi:hypothetical protein